MNNTAENATALTVLTSEIRDNLIAKDGQVLVNSRDIAARFNKQHAHILRAIKSLECSDNFTASNFGASEYTDPTGRKVPCYNMTRDGFVFLVMGFTGKEAARFKEAYIQAFNEKEAQLQALNGAETTPPAPAIGPGTIVVGLADWRRARKAEAQLRSLAANTNQAIAELDATSECPPLEAKAYRMGIPGQWRDKTQQLHQIGWAVRRFADKHGWAETTVHAALSGKTQSPLSDEIRQAHARLISDNPK